MESEEFRLGLKTRIFNYNLARAVEAKAKAAGMGKVQWWKGQGFSVPDLFDYQSFKRYPKEERKAAIAIALGVPIDSIFPESIADIRIEKQPEPISLTATEARAFGLVRREDEVDPEAAFEQKEMRALLQKALRTLADRERHVIEMRFGMGDNPRPHTQVEVGEFFGVTSERIRQIEAKALRKLRNPWRCGELMEYLPELREHKLPEERQGTMASVVTEKNGGKARGSALLQLEDEIASGRVLLPPLWEARRLEKRLAVIEEDSSVSKTLKQIRIGMLLNRWAVAMMKKWKVKHT